MDCIVSLWATNRSCTFCRRYPKSENCHAACIVRYPLIVIHVTLKPQRQMTNALRFHIGTRNSLHD
jgi:hypothetical protein